MPYGVRFPGRRKRLFPFFMRYSRWHIGDGEFTEHRTQSGAWRQYPAKGMMIMQAFLMSNYNEQQIPSQHR